MNPEEERFCELWGDYLEGELREANVAELRKLMDEDESLTRLAADTFQTHRLLGVVNCPNTSEAFVRETMGRLPKNSSNFVGNVMVGLDTDQLGNKADSSSWGLLLHYGGWGLAAILLIGFFIWSPVQKDTSPLRSRAEFASLAQAQFFGELTPAVASNPEFHRSYTLLSGAVELAFPDGATTIIEGPAVFRLISDERLAIDVGHCSVHAPEGAEGFQIDTPTTRVVDRGTRFFVNVSESSETEVQVVEGVADVYPEDEQDQSKLRLTDGNAQKFGNGIRMPLPFSPEAYRSNLPDRIISYEAKRSSDGRAESLTSLLVQRGGLEFRYSVNELIPVDLVSFNVGIKPNPIGHLVGGPELPEKRASLLEDFNFFTGIINPGGSELPLSSEFNPAETPGFAIHFRHPVKNRPGPDVVFFEIQSASNSSEGDAFHVSPLKWEDRLHSSTIRQYDLQVTSRAALPASKRYLFRCKNPVFSLAELEAADATATLSKLQFYVIAVGIDLSDLGYEDGDAVEGLFIQDAMDDDAQVDPVVIVGLPED
ncbi:MAG: FecR family protein [Verrucomicrobiales bacterium]|nr:FecR family protein [Verrucomicrobiales bacterium]